MTKGRDSFDWKSLEQLLGTSLPFIPKGMREQIQSGSWVESYVQDMMKKMMPGAASAEQHSPLEYEEFETHKDLIVKIHIPKSVHPRALRLQIGRGTLRITGLPGDKKQLIHLSTTVDHLHCKATCKNRILLIRMRKETETEVFRDIRIRME
ncbi:Hsp20/alpha crystallin family protein [Marinicrinis lubricantis]|uniref:Hsp20/alpha crystallin family protein n=1 Tax=Marinicrinis lubricantis TaxID=2086470 RepID=A0ABW1IQW3_9BACL